LFIIKGVEISLFNRLSSIIIKIGDVMVSMPDSRIQQ